MQDQALLLRTLSDFTRVLLTPYDVQAVLVELADRLTVLLDLLGSGVSLLHDDRLEFETAYGPAVAAVEKTQDAEQAGPCIQAVRSGECVTISDVREHADRWPGYAAAAEELGIRSVASIPLQLDTLTVGALDLYASGPREWVEDEIASARVMANMATVYLINASHHRKQVELTRQLREALDTRVVIEQAKGMVAVRKDIGLDSAFEQLRGFARHRGVPLRSVAEAVVQLGLEV